MARTIQSPGVEIKEIDRSQRPVLPAGTNVLVAGFADRGPTDEVIQITSVSEYDNVYGRATTPAERYFSSTIRPLLDSPANIFTYRMPYGANAGISFGESYGALAYPASGYNVDKTTGAIDDDTAGNPLPTKYSQLGVGVNTTTLSANPHGNLILGKPTYFDLTKEQYDAILAKGDWPGVDEDGQRFGWDDSMITSFSGVGELGRAAMIVLNKGQTSVNQKFEGFYVGIADNTNLNPATDFDAINKVNTIAASAHQVTDFTELPAARIDGSLSAKSDNNTITFGQDNDSVSEVMENLSEFDISTVNYNDTLSLGLFRLRQSPFTADVIKLNVSLEEGYVGSFDFHRQINSRDGGAPTTFNIENRESQSPNIKILTNEFLNHRAGNTYLDTNGNPTVNIRTSNNNLIKESSTAWPLLSGGYSAIAKNQAASKATAVKLATDIGGVDELYPIGTYANANLASKVIGNVPRKLDRLFDTIENVELFDVDISVDGGLSTIYATSKTLGTEGFDDTATLSAIDSFRTTATNADGSTGSTDGQNFRGYWKDINDRFVNFAEFRRKDHLFISDLPRQIFVQGEEFLTLSDPNKNFSKDILNPIKAFRAINSNYAATYGQWVKSYDSFLDQNVYNPFSGHAAAAMANTDSNFQPWFAPAGFTRGVVTGVNDLALYPKQKQRDQLYKISTNPVAFFPGEGFVIFGQKTLLKKPSAFDRINVRRLFLNLEKATRQTVKFFVFEPNTLLTRTRVLNTLSPIFENARNTEGVYDFLVVCDERNNTPTVIDQNELVVDIYLKPVRAAEFILVNFYATKTGADFNELVG